MGSGTEYAQAYQKARQAYLQGSYQEAADVIDQLAIDHPDDPDVLLLRGHIYCYGLQRYDVAQQEYQSVLGLTADEQYISYANDGLAYASQFVGETGGSDVGIADVDSDFASTTQESINGNSVGYAQSDDYGADDYGAGDDDFSFDSVDFDSLGNAASDDDFGTSSPSEDYSPGTDGDFTDPFAVDDDDPFAAGAAMTDDFSDPFAAGNAPREDDTHPSFDDTFICRRGSFRAARKDAPGVRLASCE